nr:cysteine proteinase inhibitor B-like [Ipomoea batatas]
MTTQVAALGRRGVVVVGGRTEIEGVKGNQEVQDLGKYCVDQYNVNINNNVNNGNGDLMLRFSEVLEAEKQVVSGIKEFRIILCHFEGLRVLAIAVQIPHLEICTLQILNLLKNDRRHNQHLAITLVTAFFCTKTKNNMEQDQKIVKASLLTQRVVSNRGHVIRAAFSLFVRSCSFVRLSASDTAFSSYSFTLHGKQQRGAKPQNNQKPRTAEVQKATRPRRRKKEWQSADGYLRSERAGVCDGSGRWSLEVFDGGGRWSLRCKCKGWEGF